MIRFKEVRIQPTRWTLDVWICNKPQSLVDLFHKRYGASKEYYEEEMEANCVMHIDSTDKSELKGERRIIMILEKMDYYVLVHELIHVLWYTAKRTGCEMNYSTQEWQAILFEYLYKECVRIDEYKTVK